MCTLSTKYPQENGYDAFVSSHGGSCNAMTEGEFTSYEFDVTASKFSEALDIFANCFISPLLLSNAIDREINSIESEFNLAQCDDGSRMQQLHSHRAVAGHLLRKFSWGNLCSLKTCPCRAGYNTLDLLRKFHQVYYLPTNSKLCVIAAKPLDELEADVLQAFQGWESTGATSVPIEELCQPSSAKSSIKGVQQSGGGGADVSEPSSKGEAQFKKAFSKGRGTVGSKLRVSRELLQGKKKKTIQKLSKTISIEELKPLASLTAPLRCTPLFPRDHFHRLCLVEPIKKAHKLFLSFQLPPQQATYRSKNHMYISHLIGHEGAGSILAALKVNRLATGLSAGVSDIELCIYCVYISLLLSN